MILLYSIFAISVLLGGLIAAFSVSQLDSANSNISSFQHIPENDSQNSIY